MRFDRPVVPEVPMWRDALDAHLRARVQPARGGGRRASHAFASVARVGRSLARPLAHGGAALVTAIVVFATVSAPRPSPTSEPAVAEVVSEAAVVETVGAAVLAPSIPMRAPYLTLLPAEDAHVLAGAADIPEAEAGLTGTPQDGSAAVPTPEGGGLATLRPRVR